MSTSSEIRHEAVEIDESSLETPAGRLVCLIRPAWISKTLVFKRLGTNDNNSYYSIFPSNDEDEQHGVVMKLYPANSDVYSNRQEDFRLVSQLAQHGITPNVLLTFTNGYVSNYVPGKALDIKEEHASQLIPQKLAEYHSMSSNINHGSHFVDKLKQYIDLLTKSNVSLRDRLNDIKEEYRESMENNPSLLTSFKSAIGLINTATYPLALDQLESQLKDTSWAELSTEIDFIRTVFETNWSTHGLPVVLCLINLNPHNFVYDLKNKSAMIIDGDHCASGYFLIDIVSYFLESAKEDYNTQYPSRAVQKAFLIEYLKYSSLNLSKLVYDLQKPTDSELERLCDLCGLLIAPVHLYWALSAFLQALLMKPTTTFDYITYGKTRLAQYKKHKQNFFLPLYSPSKNS